MMVQFQGVRFGTSSKQRLNSGGAESPQLRGGPKPKGQAPGQDQDHVQFSGRRRKSNVSDSGPVVYSSESESNYEPSDSETEEMSSTTQSSEHSSLQSSGQSAQSKSTLEPSLPSLRPRYNLRKRQKQESSITWGSDSLTSSSQNGRRQALQATPSNTQPQEPIRPSRKPSKADQAFLNFLLALINEPGPGGPGRMDWSSDDEPDGADKGKIKVISYKQSPFGPGAQRLGFQRIAGMAPLKSDLNRLLVDQIKNPQLYKDYGLEHSASGVLLYGPPGNGKTFFAKAIAEEAGANFLEIHPSSIASPYIHETSKFIGEAFDAAAKMAQKTKRPTVVLIDEVDAVAPQRQGESVNLHHNEEVAEFLNQLNECARKNVFVVATTNLPDMLDPALVRSGRMNAKIYVGAPDEPSRHQVLEMYLKQRAAHVLEDTIDTTALAQRTQGYSIADLKELVNQAARLALQERVKISEAHLRQALKTVKPSVSEDMAEMYQQMMSKFETTPHRSDEAWRSMYT